MLRTSFLLATFVCTGAAATARGQAPEASPEHKILQRDVGRWDATLKIWMGEDGKANSSVEPLVSSGTEVNRKLGDFWVIGTFKGEFAGMPFEGHAVSGYDPLKQKYVGSWVDSVSPHAMHMSGTYDKQTETLTSTSQGIGMDGKPVTGKSTLKYVGRDTRTLTMYEIIDGNEVKSMEIVYTRNKTKAAAK